VQRIILCASNNANDRRIPQRLLKAVTEISRTPRSWLRHRYIDVAADRARDRNRTAARATRLDRVRQGEEDGGLDCADVLHQHFDCDCASAYRESAENTTLRNR
jgi:hypothetical protein